MTAGRATVPGGQPRGVAQRPAADPAFDHAVITVGTRMDAAAADFEALGFLLTPRGFHSLGSINHLIVLGSTYVELLGLPPERPDARPEIRDAPDGLDALVFRTDDADATREAGVARGAPLGPVQRFTRPVRLDGGSFDAAFRTVRATSGASQAGRLYFCEHLTPELVWRDAWRAHPNGAGELVGATLRMPDALVEATLWRSLLGEDAVRGNADGFVATARPVEIVARAGAGPGAMLGLTMRVADLGRTEAQLARSGIAFDRAPDAIRVLPADAWNVELRFVR